MNLISNYGFLLLGLTYCFQSILILILSLITFFQLIHLHTYILSILLYFFLNSENNSKHSIRPLTCHSERRYSSLKNRTRILRNGKYNFVWSSIQRSNKKFWPIERDREAVSRKVLRIISKIILEVGLVLGLEVDLEVSLEVGFWGSLAIHFTLV